ncbi:MAG: autotransporter assembly complex protein TamA [Alphaproteobacteria bacterium]
MPTGYSWLDTKIKNTSLLIQYKNRPPLSLAGLRRRVKRERQLLEDLLRSEGFYASRINMIQNRGSYGGQAISVKVETGPVFVNRNYAIVYDKALSNGEKSRQLTQARNTFVTSKRAQSSTILVTEQKLLLDLANNGFPFAKTTNRTVTVDHANTSVSVKLNLTLGPRSTYGSTIFSGVQSVDSDFLLSTMGLRKGAAYSQSQLDEAKKKLLNTGLFTNVKISKPKTISDYGVVPLMVEVRERPKHQVRLSAGASIKNGPEASIEWRHRNLFGKAQNLTVKLEGDKNKAKATTNFEWPNYLREDQVLSAGLSAEYDDTNNLDTTNLSANVTIGRWYDKKRTFASIGPKVEYIKQTGTSDLWLASLPVNVDFNRTDSLLNPGKGFRIFAEIIPFLNLEDDNQSFLSAEAGISTYTHLAEDNKLTLATWTKAGAILGDDLADIPVSKRFFLGGSGSIRAYPEKGISAAGFSGALAKLEGGIEFRTRFNAKFGAVAFVEGGKVFDSLNTSLKGNWRAGAGLGFRYFSSFGPVRVDFAVPVSEPADIDDVQIQVGLGQAF